MATPSANPFSRFNTTPVVIVEDRLCTRCSYNLKGLKTTDRCPECGNPIRPRQVGGGNMTEAPLPYLDRLATWAGIGVAAAGVVFVMMLAGAAFKPGNAALLATSGLTAFAALWWGYAVRVVTEPRRLGVASNINTETEWKRWRYLTRWSQWLWGVGFTLVFVAATALHGALALQNAAGPSTTGFVMPAIVTASAMVGTAALLLAFAGLIPTAVYLSFLADWANDISLAMRLRMAPFMLLISLPVGAFFMILLSMVRSTARMIIIAPAIAIVGAGLLVCLGFFIVPLIQFAILCHWARKNSTQALDRDRRASAAIVRRVEDGKAKDQPTPRVREGKPSRPQGLHMPATGGEGYDLAPDDH
ncbi:hypothetical protein PHYC_00421 [Phycisphaerales bacterium]|nr:hypothetical protein PHYC_00421 [Phycisphaerales bacterium]